jgi:hypothetical protein
MRIKVNIRARFFIINEMAAMEMGKVSKGLLQFLTFLKSTNGVYYKFVALAACWVTAPTPQK